MSGRRNIEKLGSVAVSKYDALINEGVDEKDAARRIILDNYSDLQQEVVNFKKEIGASTLQNDKELDEILSDERYN